MLVLRSERVAAVGLLAAAVLGLLAANGAWGPWFAGLKATVLAVPGTALELSVGHWVSDGLLAVFFFVVAVELRYEFTEGQLNTWSRALRPVIAAAGGVLVPIAVFLAVTRGSEYSHGWPVPTATDIAFALGVLAVFGKALPPGVRVFLLALAILDDVVGIVIIATVFTTGADARMVALAALAVVAFGYLSRRLAGRWRVGVAVVMGALAVTVWVLTYLSGVHATIAGVALGLAMAQASGARTRTVVEPFTNVIVLPVFGFFASLVAIPAVQVGDLSPAFWGILVALPVGKIIGITLGGLLGRWLGPPGAAGRLDLGDLIAAGALGGIGFTVSLLLNDLAFAATPQVSAEGTLAVLSGSGISLAIAVVLIAFRARVHRRRAAAAGEADDSVQDVPVPDGAAEGGTLDRFA